MSALGRAGIVNRDAFYATMAGLMQINLTAPGRKEVSARMASFHAPFWTARHSRRRTTARRRSSRTTRRAPGSRCISTCTFARRRGTGAPRRRLPRAAAALVERSRARRTTCRGRGYTERDVELAASEVAGEDLHPWFEQHVGSTEDVDYDALLARAGLRLVRGGDAWTLVEIPDATPAQRAVREGWATGRCG
jgi:predicted metalloprotease with PDZ domain